MTSTMSGHCSRVWPDRLSLDHRQRIKTMLELEVSLWRIVADGGLWTTGPAVAQAPAIAVLELAGAVLAWTVDDPAYAAPRITFTDVSAAEWLWRLVRTSGHATLLDALDGTVPGAPMDLPTVTVASESTGALRRLAVGHWARRWWPASFAMLARPRSGTAGRRAGRADGTGAGVHRRRHRGR